MVKKDNQVDKTTRSRNRDDNDEGDDHKTNIDNDYGIPSIATVFFVDRPTVIDVQVLCPFFVYGPSCSVDTESSNLLDSTVGIYDEGNGAE